MPALTLQKTWSLELTTDELRLVLKALGGRLHWRDEDTDSEMISAKQLGDRITELRGKTLQAAAKDGDRLVAAVDPYRDELE